MDSETDNNFILEWFRSRYKEPAPYYVPFPRDPVQYPPHDCPHCSRYCPTCGKPRYTITFTSAP